VQRTVLYEFGTTGFKFSDQDLRELPTAEIFRLGVSQDTFLVSALHSALLQMAQFVLSQIVFGGLSLTSARVALGTVAFACGFASALYSGLLTYAAMYKVNERLPVKERFQPFWWYTEKYSRLRREYQRFYPGGELLQKAFLFEIAFFVCCGFGARAVYSR
jgi:hypothetical protein